MYIIWKSEFDAIEMERHMDIELSKASIIALEDHNNSYFNEIGADYYQMGDYESAIELYRIAAAMGNIQALANLGYCYYYGRACEKNFHLAFVYFKMAAGHKNIDALYKLSTMYEQGKGVEKNKDIADYYLMTAFDALGAIPEETRIEYPSLMFAVAKKFIALGEHDGDFASAYALLKTAQHGYEMLIAEGSRYYEKMLLEVTDTLRKECFKPYWDEEDEPILN